MTRSESDLPEPGSVAALIAVLEKSLEDKTNLAPATTSEVPITPSTGSSPGSDPEPGVPEGLYPGDPFPAWTEKAKTDRDFDQLLSLYFKRLGETVAMHPVIDSVLALKHADGLQPALVGNVMEAIERYEASNVE